MNHALELTPKQALFCDEYFKDFNAKQAALRAGYSLATALNGKLMALPKIKYHLQQRGAAAADAAQLSREMVLAELNKIAFATMGDYFGEDGKLKTMNVIKDDAKAALLNFTVTEGKYGTTVKIRMSNKLSALEKIAKHVGFYEAPEAGEFDGVTNASLAADDRYDDGITPGAPAVSNNAAKAGYKEDDDIPSEEEIENWIREAREQAIYETENKLRAEYESRGWRADAGGGKADVGGRRAEVGGIDVCENTDKYPPVGENQGARIKSQEAIEMQEARIKMQDKGLLGAAEKVIGDRPGQYTPDGYLIMQDASKRNKKSTNYDPDGGFYILKEVGVRTGMFAKCYLPDKTGI
jgi:phage terminase small subunit